jgi:UDP-N-acetyl-D-glucosamine dehydrogenase
MNACDVSVVGLGFTGLPMAVAAAQNGFRVVGMDKSAQRVRDIAGVAPGCGLTTVSERELGDLLRTNRLRVTDSGATRARVHVVCVPTPPGPDGGADLGPLLDAVSRVADCLRRGDLVIIQSTCPPGTVERVVIPRLTERSGLAPGSGFALAYSPVRIDPGNGTAGLRSMPRVVAGATTQCLERAREFLRPLTDQLVPVASIGAAELVKVFENTFKLVNISLVNELAAVCRASRVDFAEVLDAASTRPYGFLRHYPSPGAGGDCVPVAARFFAAAARRHGVAATVVETAIALNKAMPEAILHRVRRLLAANELPPLRESRVLVVGVTYKPDVPNVRLSPAVGVLEQLRLEARVGYHDPVVPSLTLTDGTVLTSQPIEPGAADLVLVLVKHRTFEKSSLLACRAPVLDCSSGQPHLWFGCG